MKPLSFITKYVRRELFLLILIFNIFDLKLTHAVQSNPYKNEASASISTPKKIAIVAGTAMTTWLVITLAKYYSTHRKLSKLLRNIEWHQIPKDENIQQKDIENIIYDETTNGLFPDVDKVVFFNNRLNEIDSFLNKAKPSRKFSLIPQILNKKPIEQLKQYRKNIQQLKHLIAQKQSYEKQLTLYLLNNNDLNIENAPNKKGSRETATRITLSQTF